MCADVIMALRANVREIARRARVTIAHPDRARGEQKTRRRAKASYFARALELMLSRIARDDNRSVSRFSRGRASRGAVFLHGVCV